MLFIPVLSSSHSHISVSLLYVCIFYVSLSCSLYQSVFSPCYIPPRFLLLSPLHPDLAVGLGLLPFHLVELGLKSFVLIGQHLEPVLQGRAFLLVATNQLAVDLVLE